MRMIAVVVVETLATVTIPLMIIVTLAVIVAAVATVVSYLTKLTFPQKNSPLLQVPCQIIKLTQQKILPHLQMHIKIQC